MEYIRSLRTGIMVEYPVMSPSQSTYLRIEQMSEAKRETYEMCRAGGGGTGIENRCFNETRDANKETWLRVIRVYARSNKVWVKSTVSTVFGPHLICREVKLNQLPQILWFLWHLGPNQSITTTLCSVFQLVLFDNQDCVVCKPICQLAWNHILTHIRRNLKAINLLCCTSI